MSNLPPGCTGNEPQIAGYPERELERECDEGDALVLVQAGVMARVQALVGALRDPTQYPSVRRYIERALLSEATVLSDNEIEDAVSDCDFVGTVTVRLIDGFECWECPKCLAEHSDEYEEPEPPEPDDTCRFDLLDDDLKDRFEEY